MTELSHNKPTRVGDLTVA